MRDASHASLQVVPRIPLSRRLAEDLRGEILSGRFAVADRLPSEAVLARQCGVSRATLREALRALEQEGLVSRRHGIGAFINRHVTARIDRLENFGEAIRRTGRRTEDRVLGIREVTAAGETADLLGVPPGTPGVLILSLRLTDGEPVLYCENVLPLALVGSVEAVERRRQYESLLDFLREELHICADHSLVSLKAVGAPPAVAPVLEVEPGTPLLGVTGAIYDIAGRPVSTSASYIRSDRLVFTILRR
ncbi:MAG: GntR family transcriptional regulator [Armatimonadota bacterium]|nr:GntR family transcriptional regulator [Armatimonadota bacterium]MDR7485916.1 GntR family transcriptional regulator [Armatimonadota bacterium]MDR7533133.1 GntR family transcriptional regulator [Armatimonadota bacterium]MDR7536621.1 GntR family transcriptional regulator [Armatimonadota bacterium]